MAGLGESRFYQQPFVGCLGCAACYLLPTLLGDTAKQEKHKYLYFEFYEEGGKQAVVADNWKYIK